MRRKILAGLLAIGILFSGNSMQASAEIPIYAGDVNQDNDITAEDALAVLKDVVGLDSLPEEMTDRGDVDLSGKIDANDALLILKKVVGMIGYFPSANSPEDAYGVASPWLESFGAKWYDAKEEVLPDSYILDKKIEIKRQGNNQCGGYAAAHVFQYFGENVSGAEVYAEIPGKYENGTIDPTVLADYIDNREGYKATLYMGTLRGLKAALCKGAPVIWFGRVSVGSNFYHFMDLTGYDENCLYMADSLKTTQLGNFHNFVLYPSELEAMWDIGYPIYSHLFIVVEKE